MDNNKDTLQTLHNRRNYLQRKLRSSCPFLRGSIVKHRSPCGYHTLYPSFINYELFTVNSKIQDNSSETLTSLTSCRLIALLILAVRPKITQNVRVLAGLVAKHLAQEQTCG